MTNSADPDQLASSEANWSESTLFAKAGNISSDSGADLLSILYPKQSYHEPYYKEIKIWLKQQNKQPTKRLVYYQICWFLSCWLEIAADIMKYFSQK